MNFKMKALVAAAVVATTMSGAANAISLTSGGEMFLVATDSISNNTYIKTLGVTAAAFDGSSNFSLALTGTDWTSFSSAASFNSSNVTYSVLGFNNTGAQNTSVMRSTASVAPIAGPALNNAAWALLYSDVNATSGGLNQWFTNTTGLGNGSVTGTGSRFIAASVGDASGAQLGNVWETKLPGITNTSAALGSNDSFYSLAGNPASAKGSTVMLVSGLLGNWNLSAAGSLTYVTASTAAVPEADSWAMAMLGLGLMGFVARRRSKQA